jgi:hypothetical protein
MNAGASEVATKSKGTALAYPIVTVIDDGDAMEAEAMRRARRVFPDGELTVERIIVVARDADGAALRVQYAIGPRR